MNSLRVYFLIHSLEFYSLKYFLLFFLRYIYKLNRKFIDKLSQDLFFLWQCALHREIQRTNSTRCKTLNAVLKAQATKWKNH